MVLAQEATIEFNVFGFNENQSTALGQFDEACTVGEGGAVPAELLGVCAFLDSLDPNDADDFEQLQNISDLIAPEEAFAVSDALVVSSDFQTSNVHSRLNALRSNVGQVTGVAQSASSDSNFADSGFAGSSFSGGGGASADLISNFGAFVTGQTSSGDFDGENLQQDTDFSSDSLTVGADYRFGQNVIAGFGIGVSQEETSFRRVAGGSDSNGVNFTAYTTWFESDKGYIDLVVDFGNTDHDLERSSGLTNADVRSVTASTSSSFSTITVSGAKNFRPFNFDLSGYFRAALTNADVDSYDETISAEQQGFASLFSIGSQSIRSTELVLGLELSKPVSTKYAVLVPLVRVEVVTETEQSKDDIEATLISTGTVAVYQGEDRESVFSNFALGASAVLSQGKSIFAFYESHLQHDLISQNWLKAGIRLEF